VGRRPGPACTRVRVAAPGPAPPLVTAVTRADLCAAPPPRDELDPAPWRLRDPAAGRPSARTAPWTTAALGREPPDRPVSASATPAAASTLSAIAPASARGSAGPATAGVAARGAAAPAPGGPYRPRPRGRHRPGP